MLHKTLNILKDKDLQQKNVNSKHIFSWKSKWKVFSINDYKKEKSFQHLKIVKYYATWYIWQKEIMFQNITITRNIHDIWRLWSQERIQEYND